MYIDRYTHKHTDILIFVHACAYILFLIILNMFLQKYKNKMYLVNCLEVIGGKKTDPY